MGIELSASRLIAPYFGASLFVWTNVIAVILAALSLGYYLGGRWSERSPRLPTLFKVLTIAGVLLVVIPFVVRPVATAFAFDFTLFSSASFMIALGSFLLIVALFFIPIMLLGMTSPFLIKIVSLERKDMGNVAGRIFAISTVGSIIGTFLPALLFIPLVGTKFTILIFAAIIILIGVAGLAPRRFFVIIPLLGVPFGTLTASLKPADGLIVEIESPYQYIQVIEREGSRYLIYNEGGGVQSKYRSETVFSDGSYFDVAALLPALTDGKRVLIVGLAGGTVSRAMQALYGDETGFHIDGVEIDPVVVRLAEQYFELDQPDLTIRSGDGRQVVALGEEKYDVLFVDAYSNQLYIPFHLTTKEFFMDARERLAPGGVLAINVNAFTEGSELLRAITNTIASVFPEVARFSVGRTSYIIFASEAPIQFERLVDRDFPEPAFGEFATTIANGIDPIEFNSGERILTDDLAPIEHLTDKMFWEYFVQLIRNEKGR